MSDASRDQPLRQALSALHATTERAWQGRPCLAAARIWRVALTSASYAPAEARHLADCPACSRRDREVRVAAGLLTAPSPADAALVSAQPLWGKAVRKDTRAASAKRVTFPSDPDLSARLIDDEGAPCLELEHRRWQPATLARVVAAARESASGPTWLAIFCDKENCVIARAPLRENVLADVEDGFLHVRPLAPPELTEGDVPLLAEAMADAARDPAAVACWHLWGKSVLESATVPQAVRRAVVRHLKPLPPPAPAGP
jgi:hypothetical protein